MREEHTEAEAKCPDLNATQAKRSQTQRDVEKLQKDIEALGKQLDQLPQEQRELQQEKEHADQLRNSIAEFTKRLDHLRRRREGLEAANKAAEGELDELQQLPPVARREFLNVVIPQRMVVENLCTGEREVLTFRPDRDSAVDGTCHVPTTSSQVVGLFLMSNGSYRLADKLDNQFHFDQAGYLTDMYLSPRQDYHVHIEYADSFTAAFVKTPYVVRPMDNERVPFLNVKVPKRVRVTDLLHGDSELLTFSEKNEIAGYVPEDTSASRFRLAVLLSNGGLQLADRHGNEARFDPGWRFKSMRPSRERRVVRSVSMGGRKATFGYTIDPAGNVMVASASFSEDKPAARPTHFVRYEHDDEGRLCRVQHSQAFGSQNHPEPDNDLAVVLRN